MLNTRSRRFSALVRRRHRPPRSRLLEIRQAGAVPSDERVGQYDIDGVRMVIGDTSTSIAAYSAALDLHADRYRLAEVTFEPGDVVVDIGAHVGVVSMYLAKRHPRVTVYAFEPLPPTFALLERNLARNRVRNVVPVNVAITADGRDLQISASLESNSGGATANLATPALPGHVLFTVSSVTLDDALDSLGIDRVRLLKIDCEGSEHEILLNARCLDRVEHLRAEFHMNGHLERHGYSFERLYEHCARFVDPGNIAYVECQMAE